MRKLATLLLVLAACEARWDDHKIEEIKDDIRVRYTQSCNEKFPDYHCKVSEVVLTKDGDKKLTGFLRLETGVGILTNSSVIPCEASIAYDGAVSWSCQGKQTDMLRDTDATP
jgi:hypothetical protein